MGREPLMFMRVLYQNLPPVSIGKKAEFEGDSSSYEFEFENGLYLFISEVSIRLISEASSSTSLKVSM